MILRVQYGVRSTYFYLTLSNESENLEDNYYYTTGFWIGTKPMSQYLLTDMPLIKILFAWLNVRRLSSSELYRSTRNHQSWKRSAKRHMARCRS